ncbi:lysoplasmalogenase [Hoeflea sp. YIM 152468]|uniref:lysoplasmalogenase n=1 Tax=Hoeflea sp. YIM 152468 TaxID=3031759 RepID=UPI0023DA2C73|nr:lysoplasmalogenase [Hoeflea sp. YIM 152468]MDF1608063.1 lysoplasmalogenase [Hoeflea sp. YIM 152468]
MTGFLDTLDPAAAALSAISVLGFGIYLLLLNRSTSLIRTIAKTVAVGALAGLALQAGGPMLLVLALALSALGDAFLAHEGDGAFLGGLGSFLAAHIAYAVLFFSSGPGMTAAALPGLMAVVVFAIAMGSLMVRRAGPLALPVAAYVLAIAGMGLGGVTLGGMVLSGVALFMASDAILGSEKFLMAGTSPLRRISGPAVWLLYYAGQLLITLGLLA